MLSYQHGYHAGNFADVHKHTALCLVLSHLKSTGKMATCLDSHSGRGLYDLSGDQAQKTGEWKDGVERILKAEVKTEALKAYVQAIKTFQEEKSPTTYPGSPALTLQEMAANHRAVFFELHPTEHEELVTSLGDDSRMRILHEDAQDKLMDYLPARKSLGALLIDPSFEIKEDYETIARLATHAQKRWPAGVIMIWYPILPEGRHEALKAKLKNATCYELIGPQKERGMYGTGMAVINAPDGFDEAFRAAEAEMKEILF